MIQKLFEAHLHVRYLERAMAFYEKIVGLKLGRLESARRAAFYWVGGHNISMLGLWEKNSSEIINQHVAFEIPITEIARTIRLLQENGVKTYNFLNDGTERPMVFGWMPAVSIYLADLDGHELEFIAPLPDRPKPEIGVISWEEWQATK